MFENKIEFEVLEIDGYELKIKKSEKFGMLVMKPKVMKKHYLVLIKELQEAISQSANEVSLKGIERGEELLELLYQRKELLRKIDDLAFELLTDGEEV